MWKIGGSKTDDAKKITRIPITFAPLPALIKSVVFIFPVAYIIALGGVAIGRKYRIEFFLQNKTYQLVT
jgi:hypothetical protein